MNGTERTVRAGPEARDLLDLNPSFVRDSSVVPVPQPVDRPFSSQYQLSCGPPTPPTPVSDEEQQEGVQESTESESESERHHAHASEGVPRRARPYRADEPGRPRAFGAPQLGPQPSVDLGAIPRELFHSSDGQFHGNLDSADLTPEQRDLIVHSLAFNANAHGTSGANFIALGRCHDCLDWTGSWCDLCEERGVREPERSPDDPRGQCAAGQLHRCFCTACERLTGICRKCLGDNTLCNNPHNVDRSGRDYFDKKWGYKAWKRKFGDSSRRSPRVETTFATRNKAELTERGRDLAVQEAREKYRVYGGDRPPSCPPFNFPGAERYEDIQVTRANVHRFPYNDPRVQAFLFRETRWNGDTESFEFTQ